MEFNLTVDIDQLGSDPAHELSRILRYWAGAFKEGDIEPDASMNVYDSRYKKVGRWTVSHASAATVEETDTPDESGEEIPEQAAPQPTPDLPETPGEPDEA